MSCDLLLCNARIVDGTGNPWFRGYLGIQGDRIACVGTGPLPSAVRIIDLEDRALTPGLIDGHTHMDLALLGDPGALHRLRQGVTTQILGLCGFSPAPVCDETLALLERSLSFMSAGVQPDWAWRNFGHWLDTLAKLPLGGNVASFVGHGALRLAIMGQEDRPATLGELGAMQDLLALCLKEGARGMSAGLIYPPGVYAATSELEALARVLQRHARLYEVHMRNESDWVVDCVRETIALAEATGVAVQISHHKASGKRNFGKSRETLALIEKARARGVDVTLNQHPYEIGSTTLRAILPGWAQEGGFSTLSARLRDPSTRLRLIAEIEAETGDWDNYYRNSGGAPGVILLNLPATPQAEGRTLAEYAFKMERHPLDLAFDLILANHGEDAAAFDNMGDEDICRIMRHTTTSLASDAIPGPPGAKTHPRLCGTFARILDLYVRQRGILSFEEAIRKMTSQPARRLGLADRGLLFPGMAADLVVIDMDGVRDTTSFADPFARPEGFDYVFVNGALTLDHGEPTGARAGRVLR